MDLWGCSKGGQGQCTTGDIKPQETLGQPLLSWIFKRPEDVLCGPENFPQCTVSVRMSWAPSYTRRRASWKGEAGCEVGGRGSKTEHYLHGHLCHCFSERLLDHPWLRWLPLSRLADVWERALVKDQLFMGKIKDLHFLWQKTHTRMHTLMSY